MKRHRERTMMFQPSDPELLSSIASSFSMNSHNEVYENIDKLGALLQPEPAAPPPSITIATGWFAACLLILLRNLLGGAASGAPERRTSLAPSEGLLTLTIWPHLQTPQILGIVFLWNVLTQPYAHIHRPQIFKDILFQYSGTVILRLKRKKEGRKVVF